MLDGNNIKIRLVIVQHDAEIQHYDIRNYYIFGICPSSRILKTREHDVLETGPVSVLS
jgi:hypothetical protein